MSAASTAAASATGSHPHSRRRSPSPRPQTRQFTVEQAEQQLVSGAQGDEQQRVIRGIVAKIKGEDPAVLTGIVKAGVTASALWALYLHKKGAGVTSRNPSDAEKETHGIMQAGFSLAHSQEGWWKKVANGTFLERSI